MQKLKDNLIGAAIIVPLTWFLVWATAVDSPGDAGLFAMGMAMSGVLVLGLEILIAYLIDKKRDRKNRPNK